MNINKLLQYIFSLMLLTSMVGLLLAITIMCHLPVMGVWVILALAAAIVYAVADENTTSQKEEEK